MNTNQQFTDKQIYQFRHLNPNNQLISEKQLYKVFHKLGLDDLKINDIQLYRRAFIDTSYLIPSDEKIAEEVSNNPIEEHEFNTFPLIKVNEMIPFQQLSYESLEFLGDGILGSIVVGYIHKRYRKEKEGEQGFLTDLKNKLVRGTLLCILAKKMKFDRYILLSQKNEINRQKDSTLEDVFEAFLGAMYIDQGEGGQAFGLCQQFLVTLMERYLDFSEIIHRRDNYKAQLLEYYHSHFFGADPKYELISRYGPAYNRTFKSAVLNVDGLPITYGEGNKKIYAEQMAAKEALKYFGEEIYSDSEAPHKEIYSDSESESL
jgi:ribonuclease-3